MTHSLIPSSRTIAFAILVASSIAMAAPAEAMSKKDRRTAVGALIGGLGGALLSNGDPMATVGGALAGGAVGNLTTKDRNRRDEWRDERWRNPRQYRGQRRHYRPYHGR